MIVRFACAETNGGFRTIYVINMIQSREYTGSKSQPVMISEKKTMKRIKTVSDLDDIYCQVQR